MGDATYWKINDATFESHGIQGPVFVRRALGMDEFSFDAVDGEFDDALDFAQESTVIIKRNDVRYFEGRVVDIERSGTSNNEVVSYVVAGPWWYLENLVFQQSWKTWNGSALVNAYSSQTVIGKQISGAAHTIKSQLEEIFDYAIAQGAPLQYDSSGWPTFSIPSFQQKDATCAEAILGLLKWVPDAVSWFDYTTDDPTFHMDRRANLVGKTVSLTDADPLAATILKPRYDLQRPEVVIQYSQVNQVDGIPYHQITTDEHPVSSTGRTFKALLYTIDLRGWSIQYVYQKIAVTTIQPGLISWWRTKEQWLNDPLITSATVKTWSRVNGNYAFELVDGSIADWMSGSYEDDRVDAIIAWTNNDGTSQERQVSVKVKSTNLTSGNYRDVQNFTAGETAPVGLAEEVYDAVNELQYDGQLTLIETEVADTVQVRNKLNVSGGRSEWLTMNALVWETVEDIDRGMTRLRVGPIVHLGPGDLIDLLRANRTPIWSVNISTVRENGTMDNNGRVEIGDQHPKDGVASGGERFKRLVMRGDTASNPDITAPSLDIDVDDLVAGGSGRDMKIRQMNVCTTDSDGNPVTKSVLVIASEIF